MLGFHKRCRIIHPVAVAALREVIGTHDDQRLVMLLQDLLIDDAGKGPIAVIVVVFFPLLMGLDLGPVDRLIAGQ